MIYFFVLDNNLNILTEYRLPLDSHYTIMMFMEFMIEGNQIYIAGDARHENYSEYYYDLFICKFELLTQNLASNFLKLSGIQFANGYLKGINSDYHYIFSVGSWGYAPGYSSGHYAKFDNNLSWIVTDSLPNDIHFDNCAMNLNDNTYLLTGREYIILEPSNENEFRSVIYKMAYPNEPIKSFEYHMGTDTTSNPAVTQSFDTTYTGEVYFSGTANIIANEHPYQDDPSWIYLSKLDRDLNPIWTKLYGGDMFYQIYSVKATHDGGAIMACRTYDHLTQGLEHDILIMKVNEDGLIVGAGEELPNITVQDAIVYPNPGSNQLKIQSGPQINGALFELFDLSGNLVLSATLSERLETRNTGKLSPGTYPYRVTFKSKIVGEGKWVKN